MEPTALAERYLKEGNRILVDGKTVYNMFPLPVRQNQRFRVRLQFRRADLRQAVSFQLGRESPGFVEFEGERLKYPRFWSDYGDQEIEIGVRFKKKRQEKGTLWIWNHWEHPSGRTDAGLNNCGILVEECTPKRLVLRCSPGPSPQAPPDFDAVRVEVEPLDGEIECPEELSASGGEAAGR